MTPPSSERVVENTPPHVNDEIRQKTLDNVQRYAPGGPAIIQWRLDALAREWDIERTLEANASTLVLLGLVLALWLSLWFLLIPFVVAGFLLWHALQGWCPPVPILRRLGFRTRGEIDYERYALKKLRGDFDEVAPARTGQPDHDRAAQVLSAVMK